MKNYNIILELNLSAENPLEAAKQAEVMCMSDIDRFTYVVQEDDTEEIHTVDLTEEDKDAVLPLDIYEPIIFNDFNFKP